MPRVGAVERFDIRGALRRLAARQELALVGLLVLTTAMMILPMPTALADVLIAANIGLSMLLMMVAIYIRAPVEFSTLPSLMLIVTAFRLSLSITTSRMVLVQADAGEIIRTFGDFVIAGNVVVGLVVYFIITIVQFVVITKGGERVAEVAARFTLDALPGKQISIDTDLKNGDLDQAGARRRRALLEKESQLYGAMDGAMKFVKGDAIASLVIIVVNLVGGMTIGCLERGLSFSEAVQTYSLLGVGDGLIAQIPALLISLTAGVIVTRVTSEDSGNLGQDIVSQLTADPRTMLIAAAVLAGLGLVPGFPTAVFWTLAIVLGAAGWALTRRRRRDGAIAFAKAQASGKTAPEAALLQVRLGPALAISRLTVETALEDLRAETATTLGIAVPPLRVSDDPALPAGTWRLDVDGIPSERGTVDLKELEPDAAVALVTAGVGGALRRCAGQFVGVQETQVLLTHMEAGFGELVREASKSAPLPRMAEVLRRLLDEDVSVANLRAVLEAVAEWGPREQNTAVLAEHVRTALRRQICHGLAGAEKRLTLVLVESTLDEAMRGAVHATPAGTQLALDPGAVEGLIGTLRPLLESALAEGKRPAVLVSTELRRHLRALLAHHDLDVPVLSFPELAADFSAVVAGTMQHTPQDQGRPRRDAPVHATAAPRVAA